MPYLESVCEVDEHDFTWFLLAAGRVQTDCSNHVQTSTLDEVVHGTDFKDLDSACHNGFRYFHLGAHILNFMLAYSLVSFGHIRLWHIVSPCLMVASLDSPALPPALRKAGPKLFAAP